MSEDSWLKGIVDDVHHAASMYIDSFLRGQALLRGSETVPAGRTMAPIVFFTLSAGLSVALLNVIAFWWSETDALASVLEPSLFLRAARLLPYPLLFAWLFAQWLRAPIVIAGPWFGALVWYWTHQLGVDAPVDQKHTVFYAPAIAFCSMSAAWIAYHHARGVHEQLRSAWRALFGPSKWHCLRHIILAALSAVMLLAALEGVGVLERAGPRALAEVAGCFVGGAFSLLYLKGIPLVRALNAGRLNWEYACYWTGIASVAAAMAAGPMIFIWSTLQGRLPEREVALVLIAAATMLIGEIVPWRHSSGRQTWLLPAAVSIATVFALLNQLDLDRKESQRGWILQDDSKLFIITDDGEQSELIFSRSTTKRARFLDDVLRANRDHVQQQLARPSIIGQARLCGDGFNAGIRVTSMLRWCLDGLSESACTLGDDEDSYCE